VDFHPYPRASKRRYFPKKGRLTSMAEMDKPQDEEGLQEEEEGIAPAFLDEQLGDGGDDGDDSGVEEALQAWAEGGHAAADLGDADEVQMVHFAQLEPGLPEGKRRNNRMNNVEVLVTVELGRKPVTVRELGQIKDQDVIELEKLAGEAFDIRVNGREFASGEVVVVTDMMAVRITSLALHTVSEEPEEE
jgi:flagellar motor switch protein FliN